MFRAQLNAMVADYLNGDLAVVELVTDIDDEAQMSFVLFSVERWHAVLGFGGGCARTGGV